MHINKGACLGPLQVEVPFTIFLNFSFAMCACVQGIKKTMAAPDWGKGLPPKAMDLIFGCRDDLKSVRGVCRNWEAAYNRTVSKVTATKTTDWRMTLLPWPGQFAAKFPFAHTVDLSKTLATMAEGRRQDTDELPIRSLLWPLFTRNLELRITTLVLHGGDMLNDDGMEVIGMITTLTRLDLHGCAKITGTGMAYLKVESKRKLGVWQGQGITCESNFRSFKLDSKLDPKVSQIGRNHDQTMRVER